MCWGNEWEIEEYKNKTKSFHVLLIEPVSCDTKREDDCTCGVDNKTNQQQIQ